MYLSFILSYSQKTEATKDDDIMKIWINFRALLSISVKIKNMKHVRKMTLMVNSYFYRKNNRFIIK